MSYHAKMLNYFRQRDRGWILSLFAVVCLIYLPFLGNPFFFDDLSFFGGTAAQYYMDAPFRFDLRWLPNASLGRTWYWFSDIPHFYHLGNALLHAGNVILIFFLLRRLLNATLSGSEHSSITWGAWLGALIFACHPVAVYAVGYVVQRNILMATLFALVMQIAYLHAVLSGQRRWLLLAVLAYVLAGFSREHSVMMPAVLVAMTILLWDKNRLDRLSLWLSFSVFLTVGIMLLLISKGMLGTNALGPVFEPMGANSLGQLKLEASAPLLHILSVFTQAGLFFKYLILWTLPNPSWMSVDMRETFIISLSAWQGWAGAISFIAYGAFGFWLLLRRGMAGLAGLALLYPWFLFVVEFSSTRMQEIFVLYRSYLWMPGLMLLVALLPLKWPGRRTLLVSGLAVLLLTSFAWNRLWIFADSYRLWDDAVLLLSNEQVQGADRIYFNRGIAVSASKKKGEAIADLERSVALSPQLAPLHFMLGVEYFNAIRYQDALAQFDETIRLDPAIAQAYYAKGITLKRLHKEGEAIVLLKKSCELKYTAACVVVSMSQEKK